MTDVYCRGPECDRPAFRGDLCEAHTKQQQRTGKLTAIAEKLTAEQRAFEAGNAMLEWDGDDAGFERLRRAYLLACKVLGRKGYLDGVRKGLEAARARGVRLGRPPKVGLEEIRSKLSIVKSVAMVAQLLGVHRRTIERHLRAAKTGISPQQPKRPRKAG
jgi:DNA invertase Pin-like site-specific DNA recombinase